MALRMHALRSKIFFLGYGIVVELIEEFVTVVIVVEVVLAICPQVLVVVM